MEVFYQYYPCVDSSQLVPQQGEKEMKPQRKRRKKTNGEGRIRKLTEEQVNYLEQNFRQDPRLVFERKDKIGSDLGLDPRRVAIWFQNRRARWKSKKLEEDYFNLKNKHDTIVVEKCLLENEVLKLKQQLNDAEKEIQRLMKRSERTWNNSKSSLLSMEPSLELGDFGMEGLWKVFHLEENNNIMDWSGLII